MPFDRDVTIDFNADISGYSQSMAQMIQQTSQYTASADGMIGKIGKLNNAVMAGVKSMSAFTQANKVATSQAAAYQQQLSKIETGARVTGKSFRELEKTTKGLAKDFPIGMKQAVEQVEALQEAGVTSNKEIGQLAKTFTKLGAATGTFGPEVGKNMLQLNRTFENGTESMEKYADSLTTVTHLYGANAGAVTSFAKSIAPVASTVGMSETSVIGLSTAFSRLGEDGYAAANTFNKVMLDMSKSIREGTPEARIYAEVMGTTSENLKQAWESNPAEGFIDFVEAIKSQGQGGIRSLEMLGLEGVRTQKTIMALANSGDMREIVEKAQSSYGNGMTGTASETAMGGVNDQLTKLNETMAQTASTAGKPFLGFLERVLGVANSISKVISDIVESDFMQQFAKVVGFAGGAFGMSRMFTSTTTGVSFGERLLKGLMRSNPVQDFRAGRADWSADVEGAGLSRRMGAATGMYFGPGSGEPWNKALGRNIRNFANMGGNALALWNRTNTSTILEAMDKEKLSTPAGDRFRAASSRLGELNTKGMGFGERRDLVKSINKELAESASEMMTMSGGIKNAATSYLKEMKVAGSYWRRAGAAGVRGLTQAGSTMSLGMLSGAGATALGGVGLAAGLGYTYYRGVKGEHEAGETGAKNAYRIFNEFAEKAGIATKGLVSFSEALAESTSKIASESKTREDAYERTPLETINAQSPGYERAYESRADSFWDRMLPGKPDAEKEALRIRGMMGANASPEALNRVQMDLINKLGTEQADKVMASVQDIYEGKIDPNTGQRTGPMSSKDVEAALRQKESESRWGFMPTKESEMYKEMAEAERTRRTNIQQEVYGKEGAQAKVLREGEAGFNAYKEAVENPLPRKGGLVTNEQFKRQDEAIDAMTKGMDLNEKESRAVRRVLETGTVEGKPGTKTAGGQTVMDFGQALEKAGLTDKAKWWRQETAKPGGEKGLTGMTAEEFETRYIKGEMEKRADAAIENAKTYGRTSGTLVKEMGETAKAFRDWNESAGNAEKTFDEWVEAGAEGATDLQRAYANVKLAPGDMGKQEELTSEIVKNAVESGGSVREVKDIITTAMTTDTGEELPALKAALVEGQQREALETGGGGRWKQAQATIQSGKSAEQELKKSGLSAARREFLEGEKKAGLEAQVSQMQELQQFHLQQRRQDEDYNRQRARMQENFARQQAWAAEDYQRQRQYSIADYHKNVRRAEEDFYTQRSRAQRDFNKQVKRQSEETAKNMFDPYQRLAPQFVTDMAVLEQSLIEQNKSISDQMTSVGKLAKMGLSKDAIDQLKLMDPGQNQEVQRLLSDASQDPTSINRINELIEKRMKLGSKLATSEYNKQYTNQKEDFEQSMKDMGDDFEKAMKRGHTDFKEGLARNEEAFNTSQSRAAAQHQTALDQMAEDNATAKTRAYEDLTGMASEFETGFAQIQADFLSDLAALPGGMAPETKTAIKTVLEAEAAAIEEANTEANTAAQKNPPAGWKYVPGRGWERVYPEGGEDSQAPEGEQGAAGSGNNPLGAERSGYQYPWRSYRNGGFHGGADIGHRGGGAYAVTDGKVVFSGVAPGGDRQNPKGSYGRHVIISDGRNDYLYAHLAERQVRAGQMVKAKDRIGTIGNTGNTRPIGSGYHLHFEVRPAGAGHGSAKDPNPWLASGGIVTNHMQPHVGEAGPEAVVPLNDRGMRFLSDAMTKAARYWQPDAAAGTRSQGYSAPVTNNVYTYDQRTQFSGPVHVESQDPEEMARKLAARERRNRLARKTGSAA